MQHFENLRKRLGDELGRMNDIIAESLATTNELMNRVVTGYLSVKGKQIRPMLVILSARFFGGVTKETLYAGASLEMLHNASLIHDDVVDETRLRRGESTINAAEGNHMAVLVGDFFVSNALAAGIRTGSLDVVKALSELGCELSMGEVEQICNVRRHDLSEESYLDMIRKKTASLFMNCVKIGGQTAGASAAELAPMVEYAELLGLCFQIRDDIFDYFDDKNIGKPTGNDLREGKVTLPLLFALQHAPDRVEAERLKALISRGDLSGGEIAELVAFAKDNGGIDYAYEFMHRLKEKATGLLMRYPESEWRDSFDSLFEYIITRNN